jgi:hypothetical protein
MATPYNDTVPAGSGKARTLSIPTGAPLERIAHEALRPTDESTARRKPAPPSVGVISGSRACTSGDQKTAKGSAVPTDPSPTGSCELAFKRRGTANRSAREYRRTIRTGSAKQRAEKQRKATMARRTLRRANGRMLIKTILVVVIMSTAHTRRVLTTQSADPRLFPLW